MPQNIEISPNIDLGMPKCPTFMSSRQGYL